MFLFLVDVSYKVVVAAKSHGEAREIASRVEFEGQKQTTSERVFHEGQLPEPWNVNDVPYSESQDTHTINHYLKSSK